MKLNQIRDEELLSRTRQLAQREREVLTQILQHLREIERRRFFSDLGYASLFDYAVQELKYSEGQAGRRIQALRLMKEFPEVEKKISSGELSLSNISQAQSFFRKIAAAQTPSAKVNSKIEKREILKRLENKSAREGQKELFKLDPDAVLPKERERTISDTKSEIRVVIDIEVQKKIDEVRSLIGVKGASMGFAELLGFMADASTKMLKEKRFGKKVLENSGVPVEIKKPSSDKNPRYVSKEIASFVWKRYGNKCTKCGGTRNLNLDHIRPIAKGGRSTLDNLRLLCFNCNQREAINEFGVEYIRSRANRKKLAAANLRHMQ